MSFGLAHYGTSVFELLAEELLMSDSTIKVSLSLVLHFSEILIQIMLSALDTNISVLLLSASFMVYLPILHIPYSILVLM